MRMLALVICWLICSLDAVVRVCCESLSLSVWFLTRKMFRPVVFVVAFLFLLSVQGFAVVANIRFSQNSYIVYEQNQICVQLLNDPEPIASGEQLRISYSFDSKLTGHYVNLPRLDGSLLLNSNEVSKDLCFDHMVDAIACEPDIIGSIRLHNNSVVRVVEPSSATITIRDNNLVNISFVEKVYILSEGGPLTEGLLPQINSTIARDTPFVIRLSEGPRNSSLSANVSSSLTIPTQEFTVDQLLQSFPLIIQDDNIALEDPEVVPLVMEIIGTPVCEVFLSPLNITQILIKDNDNVTIGFTETLHYVTENEDYVQVCVGLSNMIARVLPFQLQVNTVTATDEQDFRGSTIERQFEPLSNDLTMCVQVPIINDQVIEPNESFQVNLHVQPTFPNDVRSRLKLRNTTATVVIIDTSQCTNIDMDANNAIIHVEQRSSICFTCTACQSNVTSTLDIFWYIGDRKISSRDPFPEGKAFPNGTLMITNSSLVFNAKEATSLSCGKPHMNGSDPTQLEILYPFKVLLGVAPVILDVSMQYSNQNPDQLLVKCLFSGSPQPSVSWLFNGEQVSRESPIRRTGDTSGETYRYESVLTVTRQELREKTRIEFTCIVANTFGGMRSLVPDQIPPVDDNNNISVTSKIRATNAAARNQQDYSVLLTLVLVSLSFVCLSDYFCSH